MSGSAVSTLIAAPIDVTWSVLADVERMPEWTTSMRTVQLLSSVGLRRGSQVRIKQPWLPVSTWIVELFDPPRYFSWRARTGTVQTLGGHLLEERGPTTLATLSIRHEGPGSAVADRLLGPLTRRYMNREAAGLKERSEALVSGTFR